MNICKVLPRTRRYLLTYSQSEALQNSIERNVRTTLERARTPRHPLMSE